MILIQNFVWSFLLIKKNPKRFFINLFFIIFFIFILSLATTNNNNSENDEYSLKTSAAPIFIVNLPTNYTLYGKVAPNFSLTITNGLGNYSWYKFIETGGTSGPKALNGIPNEIVNGTFNQGLWNNLPNGTVTIRFYVNNSLGEIGHVDSIVRIDIIDPIINIISPTGGYFNSTTPEFKVEVNEPNLDKMWYTLTGDPTKHFFLINGTLVGWTGLGDGLITVSFYANDSAGNEFSDSIDINKDTVNPIINIVSPSGGEFFDATVPSFTVEISDLNLDKMWYTLTGDPTKHLFLTNGTLLGWAGLGDGLITITFYANDSAGNGFSDSVDVIKDTVNPTINIVSPSGGEFFDATVPSFIVEISDLNIDKMWYTLTGDPTNHFFLTNGTLLGWAGLGDGLITVTFYANDSAGNGLSDSIDINKDTVNPTIDIVSPSGGEFFDATPPSFIVEISDLNLDKMWYTLTGDPIKHFFLTNGTLLGWAGLADGLITVTFYANDSAGNGFSDSVDIYKDTAAPTINILSPSGGEFFDATVPSFIVEISDLNLDKMWYTLTGDPTKHFFLTNGTLLGWAGLGDGLITVTFYANDSAGNEFSDSVDVNKDTVNPTINIVSPSGGEIFDATPPSFTVEISDLNLDKMWYTLTGDPTKHFFLTNGTLLGWAGLADGLITVAFYANDSAGNQFSDSFDIYKDTAAPTINILSPSDGEFFDATAPNFIVEISDANIDKMWYTLTGDPTTYFFLNNGTLNGWAGLPDGLITITFYANDSAGNERSDSVNVIKDTVAPTINIISPSENQIFNATVPSFIVEVSDPNIDKMWYSLTGDPTTYFFLNNGTLNGWAGLPDGLITITFYANDSAGNDHYDLVNVIKDTIAPTINIIAPSDGQYFNAIVPSFIVEVSDANIDKMWYTFTGDPTLYFFTVNGTLNGWLGLPDGLITITFFANDSVGNESFDSVAVNKDVIPPEVVINSPGNNTYWNIAPAVQITVSDINFHSVWYIIEGTKVMLTNGVSEPLDSIIWNSLLEEQQFIMNIFANDSAGNINNTFSLTLFKDIITPSLIINQPANNTFWNSEPDIQITATDTYFDSVWYMVGGTKIMLTNGVPEPFDSTIWNSLPDEGQFVIYFYANDSAGNINNTYNMILYKDVVTPSLVINQPTNNTYWNSEPDIQITVSDMYFNSVWYVVGGTKIMLTNGVLEPLDSLIWNSLPAESQFTVYFYANDSAGNINDSYFLTLYKDIITPSLDVISPLNNTYWDSLPSIQATATDVNFDSIWYIIGGTKIMLTNSIPEPLNLSIWNGLLDEGKFIIYFYANDSAGNLNNTYFLTLYKDIITPVLTINQPANNTYWNSEPDIQVTVSDMYFDSVWYVVGGTKIFLTNGVLEPLDSTIWDNLPDEGQFVIYFYANDSVGHVNDLYSLTLYKDVITPTVVINQLLDNTYWNSKPDIQITVSDMYFDSVWYVVGGTKIMLTNGVPEPFDSTIWNSLPDESQFIVYIYANDSVGNTNNSFSLTLYKDLITPSLVINQPANNTYWNSPPIIQATAADGYFDSVWYVAVGTKILLTNGMPELLDSSIWNILPDIGQFTINFYANDSAGNINNALTLTLYKDVIEPIMVINSPTDNTYWNSIPTIRVTALDTNFDSVWYVIGGTKIMLSSGIPELLDSSIWDSLAKESSFNIYFYANDTAGNINSDFIYELHKDLLAPRLTINSPLNNTIWDIPPGVDVTVFDKFLDSLFYQVVNTIPTTPVPLNNNSIAYIDSGVFGDLPEGEFKIYIYAYDILLNVTTIVLTVYKDTLNPTLTINSPTENTFWNIIPNIQVTASDVLLDSVWYAVGGTKKLLSNGIPEPLDTSIWNGLLDEGPFTIHFFANDSIGHLNDTYSIILYKDIISPTILINTPLNNTYWNSRPDIQVSASDTYFDSVWYVVNGTKIMLTNGVPELLNLSVWTNLPDENSFQVSLYANDSAGNINNNFILTLQKDITAPRISIILPKPRLYGIAPPNYSVSIVDPYLEKMWYTLNGGLTNYSIEEMVGTINQTAWDMFTNENVTIRFYSNDSANNIGSQEVEIRKNIIMPIITLNSLTSLPTETGVFDELFGIDGPNFLIYKSGNEIQATWYTLDNGLTNYTFTGLNGTIEQEAWEPFPSGFVTIKFYINDSLSRMGYDDITVRKDRDMPTIIINSPNNQTVFASRPFINVTIIEPNLDSVWYRVGARKVNITTEMAQLLNKTIWKKLPQGFFAIELFANDTMGNLNDLYRLYLSKDTLGPNITIILPVENQTIGRSAPYFELSIVDANDIDDRWYKIVGVDVSFYFIGEISRINQTLWESVWDNLTQGDIITIRFSSNDSLGNRNSALLKVIRYEPVEKFKLISDPVGLLIPASGLLVLATASTVLFKTGYYKSLNKKEKGKIKKVIIAASLFLALISLFYIF